MYCGAMPTRQILYKYASRRGSKNARMYREEEERCKPEYAMEKKSM